MADAVDFLKRLQLLRGRPVLRGQDMGEYIGEHAKNKELLEINASKRVINLRTYGMTAEGTDYPNWDTLSLRHPPG